MSKATVSKNSILSHEFTVRYTTALIGIVVGMQVSCGSGKDDVNRRLDYGANKSEEVSHIEQNSADANSNTESSAEVDQNPDSAEILPETQIAEEVAPPSPDSSATSENNNPISPSQSAPTLPQIKKWHTRSGKIYDPNGKEWRGVGANLSNLMGKSRDYINNLVRREADMGFNFIRLWTPNHNSSGPVGMEDRANHIVEIMDIIHANGMQVMLVFWDTYMDLWGNSHRYYRDVEWFQKGYKGDFLTWVNTLVPKVKDHPALFMYQLINESSCRETCAIDYINMYVDSSQVIRSMDPLHLISPGGLSLTHALEGNSFQSDKNIFVEELLKADDQVVWTNSIYNLHAPNVNDLAVLKNKIPTIITEYGFCMSSSGPLPKEQIQDNTYGAKAVFDKWQVSGIAAWEATETNCGYANPTNGEFNLISEFKEIASYINR